MGKFQLGHFQIFCVEYILLFENPGNHLIGSLVVQLRVGEIAFVLL